MTTLYHITRAVTTCRLGWHSRPARRVYMFNGGRGAWLCRHCRLILATGHQR